MALRNPATKKPAWDPDNWEPVIVGPTWAKTEDGKAYALPEYTLGWEAAEFAARWLHIEDAEEGGHVPFQFTNEQLRFALWFYAIDPVTGKFLYRRALLQRLKGWGKDPFAAVLALFEAVGNCRLDYVDEAGEVHGRPVRGTAYVQIAAVSLDQTRNTADMFKALLTDEAIDHFAFNLGMEVQYAKGGLAEIHCVTSNPRALEGKRPSFIIANETQNWVEANRGHRMYGVMKGNLIKHKDQCHMLVIANAPIPGEDSVSEKLIESFNDTIAGKADDRDLLYDSLEAPPNAPLERDAIEKVITIIRGDSIWLDPETVASDFFDPLIPLSESRRKWYNQVVADSDAIYSPEQIKAAETPAQLRPGDEITLGFDGGRTDDATALVAIRIKDRVAIPIRVWERPRGVEDWIVPHDQVDSAVHDTFSRYKVKAFFADVSLWESFILGWSTDYGEVLEVRASANSPIAWDMSSAKSTTQAHMRLVHALQHAKLRHNGDPILVQHIKNTRKRYNVHGMSFGKESRESSRKVDAYAATLLAFEALNVYLDRMSGKPQKRARTGRVAMY